MSFVEKLDQFLVEKKILSRPLIVCGDFNIDTMQNRLVQNYINITTSNGSDIISNQATRVIENTQTCLDHFKYQKKPFLVSKLLNFEKKKDLTIIR